ncbi:transferase family-domain-containing protein [Mycena floridula]|nr:transferase family-domain-containing protein [Mycena floridula]
MMASTSADSVSVSSRHTVLCTNETSWTTLESPFVLGPLDELVAPFIPIPVVFVYEKTTPDVELIPVERLQQSLTLLLDLYPHLIGRLSDGRSEISSLGTGAELWVAQCSERLDAFPVPALNRPGRILELPGEGNALFPPFDPTIPNPLLTIQHTRFACGSVALGIRLYHKTCDADGFFQLVQDLSRLYRGVYPISPPHIKSYMSELNDTITAEDRQTTLDFQPPLFHIENNAAVPQLSSAPNAGRFLRFSSQELEALKSCATDPTASGSWISTFDALSAHLYRSVYRARLQLRQKDPNLGEMSRPDFLTPVNMRSRLLPPRYFPNALLFGCIALPTDVLANAPLWQIAKAIHESTRTSSLTSKDELHQTLQWIAVQPEKQKIETDFQYGNGSIMVSQWNKFDIYAGAVFDVPPILVSSPFTSISLLDGLTYLFPTEDRSAGSDKGAIDVSLALSEPVWEFLEPIIRDLQ